MDNQGIPNEQTRGTLKPLRRPGGVTILVLVVLIITAINLTRFVLSIRHWDFISSLPGISPWYIASTGLIWTLAGTPLLLGLWKAKKWAPNLMQAEVLTYAVYYWLDQVFLADHPMRGAEGTQRALLPVNWPFAAGVTVVFLAVTAWILNRPRVRAYFSKDVPGAEQDLAETNSDG